MGDSSDPTGGGASQGGVSGLVLILAPVLVIAMLLVVLVSGVGATPQPPGCGTGGTAADFGDVTLTAEQMGNAQTIVAVTAGRQLPPYAAIVAVAASWTEVKLINDLTMHDHDSIGLFQIRVGFHGYDVASDPVRSTTWFLDALEQVPHWQNIPLTDAAAAVERPAAQYRGRYAAAQPLATAVVGTLWPAAAAAGQPADPPTDPPADPPTDPAADPTDPGAEGWNTLYRHEFSDLRDIAPWQSSPEDNARLLPDDRDNDLLQHPTLSSNVTVEADPAAEDGSAMAVRTRRGSYPLPAGAADGWTNARLGLQGHDEVPPVRIRVRLRMTPSIGTKSAVMWWPSGGAWPWEVDFAETFHGDTLSDERGSRRRIDQRWHADLDGDGQATEQITRETSLDATAYHLYELTILPDRISTSIDGTEVFATTDPRFIPTGPGFFSIGKALTGVRDLASRTEDAVVVDWLEIQRPPGYGPSEQGVPCPTGPGSTGGTSTEAIPCTVGGTGQVETGPGGIPIRVCAVGPFVVDTTIASQVQAMLAAAGAAGLQLGGSGYRSNARQIELRRAHCGPTDYDIYQRPSRECSPPTAQPGESKHEWGLALDISNNGSLIRSHGDTAWQWLDAHADTYGLQNLPSEPWHWSTNGH